MDMDGRRIDRHKHPTMDDNCMPPPPSKINNASSLSSAENCRGPDESSTTATKDEAPAAPKQTRSNAWGAASTAAVAGISNKQRSSATLADIMAEQESDKIKQQNTKSTSVKFDVESEEERMMRLAIEASLRDQQHDNNGAEQPESSADNDMDEDIKITLGAPPDIPPNSTLVFEIECKYTK